MRVPVTPFKTYIRANEFTADHYYSAYPEATTTMIKSALAVKDEVTDFNKHAATFDSNDFAVAYR